MIIPIRLGTDRYDVLVERGCLVRAGEKLNLRRKALIVTDDGVPSAYARAVAAQCMDGTVVCLPQGEKSKSLENFRLLLSRMLENHMDRTDCVVAVGGGVVGDLAGFAAACYMRGVDFYNIPTTVLSQVDASIGGKTAIDLDGVKNAVGAFYQPRAVLVDGDTLQSLPPRQAANGLAEAVKMALCFDEAGFRLFEQADISAQMDAIIENALQIKKRVVEQDEKDRGLRRALNFGHTLGHGIESAEGGLYHGECVALGMLPMCEPAVRARLLPVLKRLHLPTACAADPEKVMAAVGHDKKRSGDTVQAVVAQDVGRFALREMTLTELKNRYIACWEDAAI